MDISCKDLCSKPDSQGAHYDSINERIAHTDFHPLLPVRRSSPTCVSHKYEGYENEGVLHTAKGEGVCESACLFLVFCGVLCRAGLDCNGQIVGQCPKNVEKCPTNVRRGCKHNFWTFLGQFLPIRSVLLFSDPVQLMRARYKAWSSLTKSARRFLVEVASTSLRSWTCLFCKVL